MVKSSKKEEKRKSEHYVDNVEFWKLLCEKKELDLLEEKTTKPNPTLDRKIRINKNKIGNIFLKIARGLLTKPNFINYTWDWKEDMVSNATYYMSRFVHKYDVSKKNPFAYFTTAAFRAFLQFLNKQNKYTDHFQPLAYIENLHIENAYQDDEW